MARHHPARLRIALAFLLGVAIAGLQSAWAHLLAELRHGGR